MSDGWLLRDASSPSALNYAPPRSYRGMAIVVALHLLLLWALVNGLARQVIDVVKAPIQAHLIQESRPEPPPPALPPPPRAPPPLVVQLPVPVVTAPPLVVPPMPVPAPQPAISLPPPPAEPVRPPPPALAPAPPPAPQANVAPHNPDEAFGAELRRYVNSIKRYPTSREARQLRPQGIVKVWIEIDRAGQLLGSGVEAGSGVLLLDNEALRTVRNGRFPAIPADAFAGQPSHRFVMSMEYLLDGN